MKAFVGTDYSDWGSMCGDWCGEWRRCYGFVWSRTQKTWGWKVSFAMLVFYRYRKQKKTHLPGTQHSRSNTQAHVFGSNKSHLLLSDRNTKQATNRNTKETKYTQKHIPLTLSLRAIRKLSREDMNLPFLKHEKKRLLGPKIAPSEIGTAPCGNDLGRTRAESGPLAKKDVGFCTNPERRLLIFWKIQKWSWTSNHWKSSGWSHGFVRVRRAKAGFPSLSREVTEYQLYGVAWHKQQIGTGVRCFILRTMRNMIGVF